MSGPGGLVDVLCPVLLFTQWLVSVLSGEGGCYLESDR